MVVDPPGDHRGDGSVFDAADQAGISRIYGGIHPGVDDIEGRKIGSTCGTDAIPLAFGYFDGSARP